MAKTMHDSFTLRHTTIPNRICVPPMVIFGYSDETGMVTDRNVAHYQKLAQGDPGLIIVEATCVSPEGKLSDNQLGIWSDAHIEGHKRIAEAIHAENRPALIQIHHAGVVGIADQPLCPSAYLNTRRDGSQVCGQELTIEDILRLQQAYIAAGQRAWQAGYDGIELHGCHSYLISQFFNSRVNTRPDEYADAMTFVRPIVEGIRTATDDDFIIGIRLGAYEPTLEDGITHAKALDAIGIDFLDISYGFDREADPICPEDWPYVDVVWAAGEIKKHVNAPVFAVNSINKPSEATDILVRTDVDMVDIGRSFLVDFDWAKKALAGETPGYCLHCPKCVWRGAAECPGQKLMNRNQK